jgi:hypothetical protein
MREFKIVSDNEAFIFVDNIVKPTLAFETNDGEYIEFSTAEDGPLSDKAIVLGPADGKYTFEVVKYGLTFYLVAFNKGN